MNNTMTLIKNNKRALVVEEINGVYVYPHLPCPYNPTGKRIAPASILDEYGVTVDDRHHQAESGSNGAFLSDYAEKMKDHEHDHEERAELRAAFGKGTQVINVVTGKVTIT